MSNNNYKAVLSAWVVLDQNDNSILTVLFKEPFTGRIPEFTGEAGAFAIDEGDGTYTYGYYDSDGKYWSSNPSDINREFGTNIVDITARDLRGYSYPIGVSKEFAEHILSEFQLPFHYEMDYSVEIGGRPVLVQNMTEDLLYKHFESVDDSPGFTIVSLEELQYGNQIFKVSLDKGGTLYYKFRHIMSAYKGISMIQLSKKVKEAINQAMQNADNNERL